MLAVLALLIGFTLNAEVLERYGFTLDQYNAMAPAEQRKVEDYIRAMEQNRVEQVRQKLQPKVDVKAEDLTTLQRLAPSWKATEPPPSDWSSEARLANGELSKFGVHNDKHDFELSFGDLGAGGQNSMVGRSPYVNMKKGSKGSGSLLDYGYKVQTGVVDMNARLYGDDNPAVDRRLDQSLHGLRQDPAPFAYSTDWQSQRLMVGSALGHVGRAYRLLGPVDFGWSAMGLARLTGAFPNLTLDQTAGLRVRADKDHTVGLFGGLTEAVGFVSKDIVARSIGGEKAPMKPEVDKAPHAAVAAWGRMPYFSNVNYTLEAGRQWNPWTTVQSAAAGVATEKVALRGSHKVESGADLEFSRKTSEATLSYSPSGGLDVWAKAGRDHGRLGNAELKNDSLLLGLTVRETVKSGPSASVSALFTEGDQLIVPPAKANAFAKLLQTELDRLMLIKRMLESFAGQGGAPARWEDLQEQWRRLDPATRDQLDRLTGGRLSTLMETPAARIDELGKLVNLLSDVEVLDRAVVRALRSALQKELDKTELDLLGNKVRLTAPNVLALAHAYQLGLRPLPGVTSADARNAVDPWLTKKLQDFGECGDAKLSDCLLGKLPAAEAEQLRRTYGAQLEMTLKEAVSWNADILARELNATMLRIMMASKQAFDQLTVDGGKSVAELNRGSVLTSFALLDERSRKTEGRVYERAIAREEAELRERDRAMAERLERYGRERLAWLHAQPAWPRGTSVTVRPEHWAPLLAAYGDDKLFDVVLQAKTKAKRVLIELADDGGLNALWVMPGDPLVIRLPARPPKSGLKLP